MQDIITLILLCSQAHVLGTFDTLCLYALPDAEATVRGLEMSPGTALMGDRRVSDIVCDWQIQWNSPVLEGSKAMEHSV